jgi:hypothetical protein
MLPDPQTMAGQILDLTHDRGPPTDIRAILKKWPRLGVVEIDLDGDGFLVDLGEVGAEIFVKKNKPEARKRFTLAHELGHFLLRHHLKQEIKKEEIERWCNSFAAELLLPKPLVSQHLKSGGLRNLTERLQEGPRLFQVSDVAFNLKVSMTFPVSIIHVLVSGAKLHLIQEFRSQLLDESLGGADPLIDAEVEEFLLQSAASGSVQQKQLSKCDRICLTRKIPGGTTGQRFLVVFLTR